MNSCEDACKGTDVEPELLRTIIDIAIETGGRRAKVEGLMWSNVNLSWSTMGTDDDSGTVTFQSTKNKDDVVFPIAGSALDRLRALARARVRRVDTNLVFPRPDGKRPVHTIRAFNKALKLSGINDGVDEVVVFHSLRHTTGTMILEAGGSTRDVMEILGQRTEVMARRYAHATVPHKLKIARKIAERKVATGS
jgi:integrase